MNKKDSTKRWFVCVNEQAECFKDFATCKIKETLNGLCEFYAYIEHMEDDEDKGQHFHIVAIFNKAMTFEEVRDVFNGGHLEKIVNIEQCVAYLTHTNYEAKNLGKREYPHIAVCTNKPTIYKGLAVSGSREPFNADLMPMYIDEGCVDMKHYLLRFKADELKTYLSYIREFLKCYEDSVKHDKALRICRDATSILCTKESDVWKIERLEDLFNC